MKIILILIVSFLLAGDVFTPSPMDAVQNDHIAANVPGDEIVLDPQALSSVFPAPLIPAIMAKAANQ